MSSAVEVVEQDKIAIVRINRPHARNAVDRATAEALADAFRYFDADERLHVAILTGAGGNFCAGADLKGLAAGKGKTMEGEGGGPEGPTGPLLFKTGDRRGEGDGAGGGPPPRA